MTQEPTAPAEPTVLVRPEGRVLRITLNRPRQINALTREMLARISEAIEAARDDDAIEGILLDGAGERGLCAGGDITMTVKGSPEDLKAFWAEEFDLFIRINQYPKPFVALMDGITMGGGIGLSAHSAIRVVTERSRIAMPEVRIGFIPDVGGNHILANAPGELGTHLALTAGDVYGADAILTGFADHYVDSASLPALAEAVAHGAKPILDEVRAFEIERPESAFAPHREWIAEAYAGDDLLQILARLEARPEPAAQEAAAAIRAMSPNSVVTALAAIRRAPALDLAGVFRMEAAVGHAFMPTWDFKEGVRAQIIDKDRNPQWRPNRVEEVDLEWVRGIFAQEF